MTERSSIREHIEKEARRLEEDTLHTFKQLYEAAASERRRHYWVGSVTAALSVIAGTSALAKVQDWQVIVPVVSLLVTTLTAWMTFVKPAERAQEYKNAACDFQKLREDARMFREIDLLRLDLDEKAVVEQIKALSARRAELRKDSPQPPRWAYKHAKRAIEQGEAEYEVDRKSDMTRADTKDGSNG